MKSHLKGFIVGVITACTLMGATAAYAAVEGTKIEVFFEKLTYMFDNVEKKPGEEQGFIYNGTTYVPLRFVTESLGKEVDWDESSKTIWIGKKPETTNHASNRHNNESSDTVSTGTPQYLTDLAGMTMEDEASMLNVDAWGKRHNTALHKSFQIGGTDYKKGLGLYHHDHPYPPHVKTGGTVQYNLNGNFNKLTAQIGADDSALSNTATGTVKFIGDGKELLVVDSISAGQAAQPIDLDLTGVKVLRINFNSDRKGLINLIIADPMVTPVADSLESNSAPNTSSELLVDSDIMMVERDKAAEYVVLKNRGKQEVDLKGWKVLSVSGNQSYEFKQSFLLGPDSYVILLSGNEGKQFEKSGIDSSGFREFSRSLLWTTNDIWNNETADPAELYNPTGVKVSEYK